MEDTKKKPHKSKKLGLFFAFIAGGSTTLFVQSQFSFFKGISGISPIISTLSSLFFLVVFLMFFFLTAKKFWAWLSPK